MSMPSSAPTIRPTDAPSPPSSGATPPPFWQTLPLAAMSRAQWESLCDGCGKCCLHKLQDEEGDGTLGDIHYTEVACHLLNLHTCQCSNYANRWEQVPDCVQLAPQFIDSTPWLPSTCAYRLLAEGKDLPWWHPLVSGDRETVHHAGMSVRGRAMSERRAGPLDHHIVTWPDL